MQPRRDDFTVGWICAIDIELSAVRSVLDEKYETKLPVPEYDKNLYEYGRIGGHKVVITVLPSMGITQAGIVATRMSSTFPRLRFILMVGVAGGAPSETNDIRLGDIVISKGAGRCSGVVQYDFGKETEGGEFLPTGWFNAPPALLVSAAVSLKARGKGQLGEDIWNIFTEGSFSKGFGFPGQKEDTLYESGCLHAREEKDGKSVAKEDCEDCDKSKIYRRTPKRRPNDHPHIHYGIMASANKVMKDGKKRNQVIQETAKWAGAEPLCFEMEAAGLMNDFPCLIVRGICDYSDAHKNKSWQPYAAINAAICARELLKQVSPTISAGLVEDAKGTPSSTSTQKVDFVFQDNMPFHIPFSRNTTFKGRRGTLKEIHECFKTLYHEDTPLICTITGTSGIGKTQVAIEYAYQYLNEYTSVFWVSATSEETIHASFIKIMEDIIQEHARVLWEDSVPDYQFIARKFRLDGLVDSEGRIKAKPEFSAQVRAAFFNWLGRSFEGTRLDDKKWLLIFDNVEDSEAHVFQRKESLPNRGNGAILITSRRPDILEEKRADIKIELEGLEAKSAVSLLLASASLKNTRNVKEQATAIVTELGFLPLAITQAGYYIQRKEIELGDYLPRYRENFIEAQGLKPEAASSYQGTAVTAWEKIFKALKQQDEDATAVLSTSAYFHPEEICESIWVDDKDGNPDGKLRVRFEKTMSVLASYSLVKRHTELSRMSQRLEHTGVFSVHPVIQSWARGRLKRDGENGPLRDAIILLGKVSKWKKLIQKSRQWDLKEEKRLKAHIRCLFSHSALNSSGVATDEAKKSPEDNLYFAFGHIGKRLEEQERYAEAIPWLKEASVGLAVQSDYFERLSVINSLGISLTHEKEYDEALKYFYQGMDTLAARLWYGPYPPPVPTPEIPKHSIVFKIMNNMGTALYRQGPACYGQALQWYHKAYTWACLLDEKNMLKYDIRQNSTKILRNQRNFQAANFEYNQMITALQQWNVHFGKNDDFKSFDVIVRIASLFEDQEGYQFAVNWYRDAITSFGQGLAKNHPYRIKAFRHYGRCLSKLQQYDEAKKWYESTLEGLKELNGEDYEDRKYFYTLGKKAKCHGYLKQYDEALRLAQEVLAGTEKLLGRKKEATLKAIEKVSKYHLKLKHYDEGLDFARQLLELRKELDGNDAMSLETVSVMETIALVHEEKGEYMHAVYWSEQVLGGYHRLLGPSNRMTIDTAKKLEALRLRSGNATPLQTGYGQAGQQGTYSAAPTPPPQNGYQAGYQPGYPATYSNATPPPTSTGYQAGQQSAYSGSPPPTGQSYYAPMVDPRYNNQMNPQGYQYAQNQFGQNQYAQNQHPQNQYAHGQNQAMPYNPIPQFPNMSLR
ncbi:hypothetical protein TWF506_002880 [Arthrobotrys conoides]|uniref:Nucleoside phosphorylase domain-containing protein n=1 Tax=Arthrobotrys conoides TaxID=74498 RepID=A0AAN8N339_9PEZI